MIKEFMEGKHETKTSSNLMKAFMEGKHDAWTPQDDVDKFFQEFPDDYVPLMSRMTIKILRWAQLPQAPTPMLNRHQVMGNKQRMSTAMVSPSRLPPPFIKLCLEFV